VEKSSLIDGLYHNFLRRWWRFYFLDHPVGRWSNQCRNATFRRNSWAYGLFSVATTWNNAPEGRSGWSQDADEE